MSKVLWIVEPLDDVQDTTNFNLFIITNEYIFITLRPNTYKANTALLTFDEAELTNEGLQSYWVTTNAKDINDRYIEIRIDTKKHTIECGKNDFTIDVDTSFFVPLAKKLIFKKLPVNKEIV